MGDQGAADIVHHCHNINVEFTSWHMCSSVGDLIEQSDNIPVLVKPIFSRLWDKLAAYLSSDPEYVDDMLGWWYEKQ